MAKHAGFVIGRGGTVFLLRENGSRQKCGFRIHDGHIEVFERRTSTWHVLPEVLASQNGKTVTIAVISG